MQALKVIFLAVVFPLCVMVGIVAFLLVLWELGDNIYAWSLYGLLVLLLARFHKRLSTKAIAITLGIPFGLMAISSLILFFLNAVSLAEIFLYPSAGFIVGLFTAYAYLYIKIAKKRPE